MLRIALSILTPKNSIPHLLVSVLVLAVALLIVPKAVSVYATPVQVADAADTGAPLEQADDESEDSLIDQAAPIDSLDDVEAAVIQIDVLSELEVDSDAALLSNTVVNRGSGFIIDPSGLAVTSSSLLAGSRFLKVLVNGESLPRKAYPTLIGMMGQFALD